MKFRKKPIIVNAEQVTEQWFEKDKSPFRMIGNYQTEVLRGSRRIEIATLEGIMYARRGDWIVIGINGEAYPVKDEIFRKTYEPVIAKKRGKPANPRLNDNESTVITALKKGIGQSDIAAM